MTDSKKDTKQSDKIYELGTTWRPIKPSKYSFNGVTFCSDIYGLSFAIDDLKEIPGIFDNGVLPSLYKWCKRKPINFVEPEPEDLWQKIMRYFPKKCDKCPMKQVCEIRTDAMTYYFLCSTCHYSKLYAPVIDLKFVEVDSVERSFKWKWFVNCDYVFKMLSK
jgi:hypothetical protein